ncbi:MAG: hypothetical protein ACK2T3_10970, partial [Candidatus Promineifilaceae bacterium]
MNNSQSVEFGAIITISLPDQAGEADYHVVLAPSDLIVGDENQMKPLGDCTLSELRRFADELEADVWSAYEAMSLFDIVVDGRATISVVRADDRDTEAPPKELTLQHLVIFPGNDEAVLEAVDAESGKIKALEEDIADALKTVDEPFEISEEVVSSRSSKKVQELESALDDLSDILDAKSEAKTRIGAEQDQPAEKESATAVERGIETVEDEAGAPDVSVSQSELVHEEAEAPEIIKPVKPAVEYKKPLFRILGKRRPPNHPTWTAVDILMSERAFRAAQVHANSSLDREVAGVLLGPHPEK